MSQKRKIFVSLMGIVALFILALSSSTVNPNGRVLAQEEVEEPITFMQYDQVNELEKKIMKNEIVNETYTLAEPRLEVRGYDGRDGNPWMASMTSNGVAAVESMDYVVTTDYDGNVISKTPLLGTNRTDEGEPAVLQYGSKTVVGAIFDATMTTYGVDCYGCVMAEDGSGGTSAGIRLHPEKGVMVNGNWQAGIQYGDYYIVAADPSIPLCSILEISNHGYTGQGLTPGVPFKAIVLDRGGAIKGAKLDLYKGSESDVASLHVNHRINKPHVEVVRVGGRSTKNNCYL